MISFILSSVALGFAIPAREPIADFRQAVAKNRKHAAFARGIKRESREDGHG
jgi:hypothetical protein